MEILLGVPHRPNFVVLPTLFVFGLILWCCQLGFAPAAFPRMLGTETYEIVRELGSGGFAITYMVTNMATGQEYAMKKRRPHLTRKNLNSDFVQGIQTQIKLSRLAVTGVPKVHHWSLDDDPPWIVMQLTGLDFSDALDRTDIKIETMFHGILKVVDILSVIHKNGYIHRDVKPENMAFALDGDGVFLLDYDYSVEASPQFRDVRLVGTRINLPLSLLQPVANGEHLTYNACTDLEGLGWSWADLYSEYYRTPKIDRFLPGLVQYMLLVFKGDCDHKRLADALRSTQIPITGWTGFPEWFASWDWNSEHRMFERKEQFKRRTQSMTWKATINLQLDGSTIDGDSDGFTAAITIARDWATTKISIQNQLGNGITTNSHFIRYYTDSDRRSQHNGNANLSPGDTVYVNAIGKATINLQLDGSTIDDGSDGFTAAVTIGRDWATTKVSIKNQLGNGITTNSHFIRYYTDSGRRNQHYRNANLDPGDTIYVNAIGKTPFTRMNNMITSWQISCFRGRSLDEKSCTGTYSRHQKPGTRTVVAIICAILVLIILAGVGLYVHCRARRENSDGDDEIAICEMGLDSDVLARMAAAEPLRVG